VRLILQCAVCGTVNPVGLTACGACRATGLENLRLLFECLHCFRVGLMPKCEACSRLLPLDPAYEVVQDPLDPDELARRWGVGDEPDAEPVAGLSGERLAAAGDKEPFVAGVAPADGPGAAEKPRDEVEVAVEDGEPRREPPA
jgi:hypothetical protein